MTTMSRDFGLDSQLLSATSVKVGEGYRLALPTGAHYTWKGSILEGAPIEPDQIVEFDCRERRNGADVQLKRAIESGGRKIGASQLR
jgi:carboxyl-terminal processing protease